ncbi:MAG: hypothetical protein ABSD63_07025 [Candidatus Korobacteraceae bacterium]
MSNPTIEVSVALVATASAFLVAWIAGAFSLLGLLISKEQKVSEFRQTWIDALRADIAALVAHAYQIHAFLSGPGPVDYTDFWNATRDDYIELNQASTRIKLRINRNECDSRMILQSMKEMEVLFSGPPSDLHKRSLMELNKIVEALERDAPPLLKKEWERVKSGEPIYRLAKWMALFTFLATGLTAVCLFWKMLR